MAINCDGNLVKVRTDKLEEDVDKNVEKAEGLGKALVKAKMKGWNSIEIS